MAAGDAVAGDVPGRYDVVINGKGYRILDTIEPSLPFRSHRAIYGISPTFIERTNITGAYGDNQQSFWLTYNQNDWGLGEQQRYFRPNGADADTSKRRYWSGTNVDVTTTPGHIAMAKSTTSIAFAATVKAIGRYQYGNTVLAATDTNLYEIDATGAITDHGAHGAGNINGPYTIVGDTSNNAYIAGGTAIRKWNGSAYSTFSSASTASSIAFLNNILYSAAAASAGGAPGGFAHSLRQYDTSGNESTIFTWQGVDGTATVDTEMNLIPFGGDLLILRSVGEFGGSDLYQYDGNGVSKLASFARNFRASGITVESGVAFIAGSFLTANTILYEPGVYYYANGNIGILWRAGSNATGTSVTTSCRIDAFQGRVVWTDNNAGVFRSYDLASGGVSQIGTFTPTTYSNNFAFCAGERAFLYAGGTSTGWMYPSTAAATSSVIQSSLYDFDSSLTKLFRGITVEYNLATDGNGGSVDIAYQLNSVDGVYTSLQVGATSGTEYTLSQTGQALSVQVTLNKGTSTLGPVLKRVYVRAAPQLQTYRFRTYLLDLSGIGWKDPVKLLDGTYHTLSGHEQAANLFTAFTSGSPFSVTDRFTTFTGICDITPSAANPAGGCEVYEVREGNDDANFSGGFVAKVTIREV